jgi:hypothetical protein
MYGCRRCRPWLARLVDAAALDRDLLLGPGIIASGVLRHAQPWRCPISTLPGAAFMDYCNTWQHFSMNIERSW